MHVVAHGGSHSPPQHAYLPTSEPRNSTVISHERSAAHPTDERKAFDYLLL